MDVRRMLTIAAAVAIPGGLLLLLFAGKKGVGSGGPLSGGSPGGVNVPAGDAPPVEAVKASWEYPRDMAQLWLGLGGYFGTRSIAARVRFRNPSGSSWSLDPVVRMRTPEGWTSSWGAPRVTVGAGQEVLAEWNVPVGLAPNIFGGSIVTAEVLARVSVGGLVSEQMLRSVTFVVIP